MERCTDQFKLELWRLASACVSFFFLLFFAEPMLKQSIYAGLDAFNVTVLRTVLIKADVFIFLAKGYSYIDVIITNFVAERRQIFNARICLLDCIITRL